MLGQPQLPWIFNIPGPALFAVSVEAKLNTGKLLTSFQMFEVWESLSVVFSWNL